jgi:hypothetical protein
MTPGGLNSSGGAQMPPQVQLFTKFLSKSNFLTCCPETESLRPLTKTPFGLSAFVERETLAIRERRSPTSSARNHQGERDRG